MSRFAPNQPDAYYLLGVVLRDEVGDRPSAALRFATYLRLAPTGAHVAEARAALDSTADPKPSPTPTPTAIHPNPTQIPSAGGMP